MVEVRAHFEIMRKVHSLYSEQLVPTPILISVPSQFSPFVREITNAWHALQNKSCPKSPLKENKERHKGQFQLVQSTVDKL